MGQLGSTSAAPPAVPVGAIILDVLPLEGLDPFVEVLEIRLHGPVNKVPVGNLGVGGVQVEYHAVGQFDDDLGNPACFLVALGISDPALDGAAEDSGVEIFRLGEIPDGDGDMIHAQYFQRNSS